MPESLTLVSEQAYLQVNSKPACEYDDGVLTQKPMPTLNHSLIQSRLVQYLLNEYPAFVASTELTVHLRAGRYLVPDVALQQKAHLQRPYPTKPIPLCVEVLSPDDRFSDVLAKCDEYHVWGVPMVWIIDPERRLAWEYGAAEQRPHEIPEGGTLAASPVAIPLAELFAILPD